MKKCILICIIIFSTLFIRAENKINLNFDLYISKGTGVNIHFTGNPIDINFIKNAGFKYVRMDITWASIEKKKDEYDFGSSGYDSLTNALITAGITPYYILDYSNNLYTNEKSISTVEAFNGYSNYVDAVTTRYKNKRIIWEIWNEPNSSKFWERQPDYDNYAKLVNRIAQIIRKNDPSGIIVAPALSDLSDDSLNWLEEIMKRNVLEYIDAISIHAYRSTFPETVIQDYEKLKRLKSKYSNKEIDIISGEWGYSTGENWNGLNLTENNQAEYLARMFLLNLYQDIPISIWYDWKNDGTDANNSEHNFGLRENDVFIPKKAYYSGKVLNKILSGYKFSKRIEGKSSDDYILFLKNNEGNYIVVGWTTVEKHNIELPKYIKGKILSLYGEEVGEINQYNSKLEISSSPKYIIQGD